MKDRQHQPGVNPSPESMHGREPAFSGAIKGVVEKILQTRECRSLIADTIPVVMRTWAGKSRWRNIASKLAAASLHKGFCESSPNNHLAIEALFQDPAFIDLAAEFLSDLFADIEDLLARGVQTLEGMPLDDKKRITAALVSGLMNGTSGDILTRTFRVANELQQNDPEFLTRMLAPGFEKWVAAVDFGELKEAVDGSAPSVVSLVRMANDVMWQYPAKVILLLSLLPSLVNIVGSTVQVSARKLEDIPPDLLSDILISMIREIDGSMVAELASSFTEMVRKLHTGSALLGEAGAPQLPKLFSEKMSEFIEGTDPAILWKSRIAMTEIKASLDHALAEAIHQNGDHLRQAMVKGPQTGNIRRQNINRRLTMFESMDDDTFAEIMTEHLSTVDAQEAADVLNNLLRLTNRIGDLNPKALADIVFRFSSAIDDYELSETARRLISDAHGHLTPAARSVVPGFVTWMCRVLETRDDEYEEDARRAREALRALLITEKD